MATCIAREVISILSFVPGPFNADCINAMAPITSYKEKRQLGKSKKFSTCRGIFMKRFAVFNENNYKEF